ncbi:MAG: DUF309 domain-containing protein [Pleurocapsa minor GSE-CHR-MK-17-07R]|jgi:predicted metal-dependent hydrolase|nr:DUF309 domain-containing protein [Pleurocapsa minor GSE-CHR-MK 17-07R]
MDACSEPLPPRAQEAISLFNSGEYYLQHDLLEALWRDEPRRIRDLYQGILQVGVAYYQATRGNRRGAVKMLLRAERWLADLPDVCQTVDVAALRADAARVKAALLALRDDEMDAFDTALFQPVKRA